MKGPVVTVTLNPMIDKTIAVPSLARGKITRASSVEMVVGGKGINVSRQLHHLGVETLAVAFAGGETGRLMDRLLEAEGIAHELIDVQGMTREGVTYRESDGTVTSVFEPQHGISTVDNRRLVARVEQHISSASWVVLSGGSPGVTTDATFAEIVSTCVAAGTPVALDSYGPSLRAAIDARPTFIKPNRQEYEDTFGVDLADLDDMANAARERVRRGVTYCVISDGAGPGVAASPGEAWIVNPPAVSAVNPTGSGDTLVAAVVYGLVQGWSFPRCLTFGTAAATANAAVWNVASVEEKTIRDMMSMVVLRAP
jgi:1-phosphofructokinase family hexose kinase